MTRDTITYDVTEHVATVTLSRPQALNTFDQQMCDEFAQLWSEVRQDDDVHVVVLRANGDRAFSVGADVTSATRPSPVWDLRDPGEDLGPKHNQVWKPVVCAVHGMCAGGAFYWLNEADVIIAAEGTTFFDPHVTYGRTAAIEPVGLRYRMPLGDVLRMVLLGNDERMSVERALAVGLVTEIVAPDTLWQRAHEIALLIADKPPVAVQGSIKAIWQSLDLTRTAALSTAAHFPQLSKQHLDPAGLGAVERRPWTLR